MKLITFGSYYWVAQDSIFRSNFSYLCFTFLMNYLLLHYTYVNIQLTYNNVTYFICGTFIISLNILYNLYIYYLLWAMNLAHYTSYFGKLILLALESLGLWILCNSKISYAYFNNSPNFYVVEAKYNPQKEINFRVFNHNSFFEPNQYYSVIICSNLTNF